MSARSGESTPNGEPGSRARAARTLRDLPITLDKLL
jgi:hypothetical protein